MGEGETGKKSKATGKKAKATPHVGAKSVSEKSQVAHTRKNPLEKSCSQHTYMKSLVEHGSIKQPWFDTGNPRSEFPVSSAYESIKAARISI